MTALDKSFSSVRDTQYRVFCVQCDVSFANCCNVILNSQIQEALNTANQKLYIYQNVEEVQHFIDDMNIEPVRSFYKRPNGGYSAKMCPGCFTGPLTNEWCNDLMAHDGQYINQNIKKINNKCPGCNKNFGNWETYPEWDGRCMNTKKAMTYNTTTSIRVLKQMEIQSFNLKKDLSSLKREKIAICTHVASLKYKEKTMESEILTKKTKLESMAEQSKRLHPLTSLLNCLNMK